MFALAHIYRFDVSISGLRWEFSYVESGKSLSVGVELGVVEGHELLWSSRSVGCDKYPAVETGHGLAGCHGAA